jgi:hypothetical protein
MYPDYQQNTVALEPVSLTYYFDPGNGRAHVRLGGAHLQAPATSIDHASVAAALIAQHLQQPREDRDNG